MINYADTIDYTRIFLESHLTPTQALKVNTYNGNDEYGFYFGDFTILINRISNEISTFTGDTLRRTISMERFAGCVFALSMEIEDMTKVFNKSACYACQNKLKVLNFLRN